FTVASATCPNCGSSQLHRFIFVTERFALSIDAEYMDLVGKDPSRSWKNGKIRRELYAGRRPEGSGSGRIVDEYSLFDHNADRRVHRIVDVETGKVLHDVDHKLSDHPDGTEKTRKPRP